MFRVLRPDAFCVTFYGYTKIDLFMDAWKSAGFRVAGHFVFPKKYTSSSYHTQYRHEQAYLLAKGWPQKPRDPPPDVIYWTYTGNKLHPTQKPLGILKPLIEAFSQPGDTVLDPFCGSGSTLVGRPRAGPQLYRHRTRSRPSRHRAASSCGVKSHFEISWLISL